MDEGKEGMSEELDRRWQAGRPVSKPEFRAIMENLEYRQGTLRRRRPVSFWRRWITRIAIWYAKRRLAPGATKEGA